MRIVFVLSALLLAGCASDYSKFYRGTPSVTPEFIAKYRSGVPPKTPTLTHAGGSPSEVVAAYARRGYGVIGYSAFSSGHRESDAAALEQGTKVGADVVVVMDPKYVGSVTTSVPLTTPTATTSYTTENATAYGSGGSVTAYGNSTTTTYGSQTTYLPMTIHRFDYGALYLFRRHWHLGASFRDLSDAERSALQSNKGVYIISLVDGSPAYAADILVGDLIVAIDGQPVLGQQSFTDLLVQRSGRTIELTVVRGGQTIKKSVALAE
jgi:PDZ domain